MAEEADAGAASLAAGDTSVGRVVCAGCGLAFLSAGALFLSCSCHPLFTGFEVGGQGSSPLWAVSCQVFPVTWVDVQGLHVSLAGITVAELGAACASLASSKLAVEDVLGILPSSMRRTWPSHRSRRWRSRVNMEGRPALARTSVLVILSCHVIPSMRRRQRMWKEFSLFSCRV